MRWPESVSHHQRKIITLAIDLIKYCRFSAGSSLVCTPHRNAIRENRHSLDHSWILGRFLISLHATTLKGVGALDDHFSSVATVYRECGVSCIDRVCPVGWYPVLLITLLQCAHCNIDSSVRVCAVMKAPEAAPCVGVWFNLKHQLCVDYSSD